MATYTSELDSALLAVPWTAKVDTASKPFMLYSTHPSKPGYVVILTDLEKVYFEPLAGIRVLARQREVEEKFGQSQSQRDGSSSLDLGGEEAVADVLDQLALLMSQLDDVEMEVKAGDLYDLDVTIRSPQGHWLYHMTEIRTDCLGTITRHVIHPLALSITSSRRPVDSTQDQIVELVSSSTVLQALNRHSSHTKKSDPESKAAKSPMNPITKSPSKAPRDEVEGKGESKTRLVRRRPAIESSDDAGPSPPQRTSRTKSPSPATKRAIDTLASRIGTVEGEEEEDESMPPEDEEETRRSSEPQPDPTNTPSRSRMSKPDPPPDDDEGMDEDKTPEPSPPPAPSQKTQQEKDEDEEEVLAKKREEMKRKMGAGGGGRLVRRRFG